MEVAVALGLDPVTAYSASAPLPKHIDELMFAGFLRGEAVDVVKGVTVDLEVPGVGRDRPRGLRRAGRPRRGRARSATTPATTRAAEPFPVFHLTALTMRRDAIYPSIVVGKPPPRTRWLGKATERIFLPAIRASVPEIVDYDLPVAGRVPQLRDRLDPQDLPGAGPEGDARDLGARPPLADEDGDRRRRARRPARLRRRSRSTPARTSTRPATSCSPRARPTISTTPPRASSSGVSSGSTPPRSYRRRERESGRPRSR